MYKNYTITKDHLRYALDRLNGVRGIYTTMIWLHKTLRSVPDEDLVLLCIGDSEWKCDISYTEELLYRYIPDMPRDNGLYIHDI